MVGQHVRSVSDGIMCLDGRWTIVLLAFVLECTEYMMDFHKGAERVEEHLGSKYPVVFTLANRAMSPATGILQYLSSLLADHPAQGILCRLASVASCEQLHA